MTLIFLWAGILFIMGIIIFGVFAYLCFVWTYRKTPNFQNIMTGVQVSALYVFKIFFYSVLIFIIIYLVATFSLTA